MTHSLRDLIYFDSGKASSLLSQLEDGLLQEIKESEENIGAKSGEATLDLKFVEGSFGKESTDRIAVERTKILHHNMLNLVEEWLFGDGFALDLNEAMGDNAITAELFRELIGGVSYLRVEGWPNIDDFTRLQEMAGNFATLVEFINKCNRLTLEQSGEYQSLQQQIEQEKSELKNIKDRNARSKRKKEIQSQEDNLSNLSRTKKVL